MRICLCMAFAVMPAFAQTPTEKFYTAVNELRAKFSQDTSEIINSTNPQTPLNNNWLSSTPLAPDRKTVRAEEKDIAEAENKQQCESEGGVWNERARLGTKKCGKRPEQESCEKTSGHEWIWNEDKKTGGKCEQTEDGAKNEQECKDKGGNWNPSARNARNRCEAGKDEQDCKKNNGHEWKKGEDEKWACLPTQKQESRNAEKQECEDRGGVWNEKAIAIGNRCGKSPQQTECERSADKEWVWDSDAKSGTCKSKCSDTQEWDSKSKKCVDKEPESPPEPTGDSGGTAATSSTATTPSSAMTGPLSAEELDWQRGAGMMIVSGNGNRLSEEQMQRYRDNIKRMEEAGQTINYESQPPVTTDNSLPTDSGAGGTATSSSTPPSTTTNHLVAGMSRADFANLSGNEKHEKLSCTQNQYVSDFECRDCPEGRMHKNGVCECKPNDSFECEKDYVKDCGRCIPCPAERTGDTNNTCRPKTHQELGCKDNEISVNGRCDTCRGGLVAKDNNCVEPSAPITANPPATTTVTPPPQTRSCDEQYSRWENTGFASGLNDAQEACKDNTQMLNKIRSENCNAKYNDWERTGFASGLNDAQEACKDNTQMLNKIRSENCNAKYNDWERTGFADGLNDAQEACKDNPGMLAKIREKSDKDVTIITSDMSSSGNNSGTTITSSTTNSSNNGLLTSEEAGLLPCPERFVHFCKSNGGRILDNLTCRLHQRYDAANRYFIAMQRNMKECADHLSIIEYEDSSRQNYVTRFNNNSRNTTTPPTTTSISGGGSTNSSSTGTTTQNTNNSGNSNTGARPTSLPPAKSSGNNEFDAICLNLFINACRTAMGKLSSDATECDISGNRTIERYTTIGNRTNAWQDKFKDNCSLYIKLYDNGTARLNLSEKDSD